MDNTKIALIQLHSGKDALLNLDNIKTLVAQAASNGAKLVMLPEVCDYTDTRYGAEITGVFREAFSELACEHGIYLHGGSIHEYTPDMSDAGQKPYNTTFFYDPSGAEIASYRKIHMFDVEIADGPSLCESHIFSVGDSISCANTVFGALGLSICFDLRFPALYHDMALSGATILCCAANFTKPTGEAHWEVLQRARAIETGSYVLACNQCGQKKDFTSYGHSMVIDPWGQIVAEAGDAKEIIYADIDPDYPARARRQIPVIGVKR